MGKTLKSQEGQGLQEIERLKKALEISESKFASVFEHHPMEMCILRALDSVIVETNISYASLTGYTREEMIGKKATELEIWCNQSERDKVLKTLQEKGRIKSEEHNLCTKSGEIRPVLLSIEPTSYLGDKCFLVTSVDIQASKQIKAALTESEEKFSKVFSTSVNAISILSIEDGKYIDANESFLRFTGYSRDEVVGHNPAELNLWVNQEEQNQWISALRKDGRAVNHEFRSRAKSGEIHIALASAEIIRIGGKRCRILSITDITDRKRAEEALKKSEENFRNSIDESPLGIRIVDLTGETIYTNRALLDIYGCNNFEEMKTANPMGRFTTEMYQKHVKMRELMKSGRIPPPSGETSIVRKNGEIRHLQVLTKEVLWNGVRQFQLLYLDITERKIAEEKLKQVLTSLEQSNTRLAAANKELETFSYSVSHDLRSPLRSIDGFSQALLEDYSSKLDAIGQDYLQRLRNASQKMGELIDGILRLSRLSRSELRIEKINLGTTAREIADRLKESQPERNADFTIEGDLTALGDPQLVRALLENLLGNAWKFTSKVPHAVIEFGAKQEGPQKIFFVKDNGAGFDMAYVDKLFGAFQRLHDTTEFPGTGIGLATVQRIINRHSGTVRAEGEVGKGATFYFTLG